MTLCLAAVCDSGKSIACVFDERFTTTHTAADALSKAARINVRWLLLYAGDDIRHVGTVYDRVKRQLLKETGVTLEQVQDVVLGACQAVIESNLTHGPLMRGLGVSVAEFTRRSRELVSDDRQRREVIDAIRDAKLGSDFLLAGFDERNQPHIVAFPDGGEPLNFDRRGYGSVGSGHVVAEHHMAMLNYSKHLPALAASYALCASKFTAESAFVGEKTELSILRTDESLWKADTKKAREIWDQNRPRIPVGIEEQMSQLKQLWPTQTVTLAPERPAAPPVQKSPTRGRRSQQPSQE